MQIIFVIHGLLRNIDALKKSLLFYFEKNFTVGFIVTTKNSGAKDPVIRAIIEGAKFVIIVGGDGSVNEGINGYMMVSAQEREEAIMGVLPMGTGNDFSRMTGIKDVQELHAMIQCKSIMDIDVCLMNFVGKNEEKRSRYFINMADIGLGGLVARNLDKRMTFFGPNFYYFYAIISSFFQFQKPVISLNGTEYSYFGKIMSVCMANGKYIGSGLCLAPDACLNDGKMQLTIIGEIHLLDFLRNLPKLRKGLRIHHENIQYVTVDHVDVISKNRKCPVEMDGEFIGYTPVDVRVLSRSVKMIGKW